MKPFTRVTALACPLPIANIDTDQLIPARFMRRTRKEGYGPVLLHDLRFEADGAPKPDFPLARPEYSAAGFLVARRNFGSGSSREAAVYALADFGIRAVIAPSFGDIFAQNAVNNGLLPVRLPEDPVEQLLASLMAEPADITVDLENSRVEAPGLALPFTLDPVWRTKLLNGWDDLDLTLSHRAEIEQFMARDASSRPWMMPDPSK
ncbi:MAG: 3-isopropylmalate dehydratase small subunit [Methylobacterium sp.]|nr:3-isopropylmalate dehydratase small subunit [Methylobacterium sp.]MCA3607077.1 3-isopropylmalate dehydratase small subunit [Methylobacterium sp.]MCA3609334.1 3-isopropylmalate dehydratase small subunit [Methylobacterium sp.]MCA3619061.1 3-isopropylmalate dehydratase small subunit [Methylobacterium sp.]MCA3621839.1 3-isopropylmalate dehydratase small subunit [Methylobacterium sp.]